MKTSLIVLILFSPCVGIARGENVSVATEPASVEYDIFDGEIFQLAPGVSHATEEGRQKSKAIEKYLSGDTPTDTWLITKGTESYTLNKFVSSGKFCEWKGYHMWSDPTYYSKCITGTCAICSRCRRRIKEIREIEELEP